MAVTYRSAGTSPGTSSTTCVITAPTGIQVGDLLIATITSQSSTAISGPAGFTSTIGSAQVDGNFNTACFYKVAVSADTSAPSYTFTCGSESNTGVMIRVDGQATGTIFGTPAQAFGSGTTASAGSAVTMQSSGSLLVAMGGASNDGNWTTCSQTCTSAGAALDQYTATQRGFIDTTSGSDCAADIHTVAWTGNAEGGSSGTCSGNVTPSSFGNMRGVAGSSNHGTWVVVYAASDASSIKTVDGLAKASVKTVCNLAIASVKTIDGLA